MMIGMSLPSKTFLAGEYAVLCGGEALVVNTEPRFQFRACKGDGTGVQGIVPASPAGQWLEKRAPLWRDWRLEFQDPHSGAGGFGASSAQFVFVHSFTTFLQASVSQALRGLDLPAIWSDFCALNSGSGVDVVAQATGGVARVNCGDKSVQRLAWPYADLDFAIVRTGHKVPTHTHLQELNLERLQALLAPARAVTEGFGVDSAEEFVHKLNIWAGALSEMQLQTPSTLERLQSFRAESWCLATKGCGALGADTILLVFERSAKPAVESAILSEGLMMNWGWQ